MKIIIEVEGGIVQCAYTDIPGLELFVADRDEDAENELLVSPNREVLPLAETPEDISKLVPPDAHAIGQESIQSLQYGDFVVCSRICRIASKALNADPAVRNVTQNALEALAHALEDCTKRLERVLRASIGRDIYDSDAEYEAAIAANLEDYRAALSSAAKAINILTFKFL